MSKATGNGGWVCPNCQAWVPNFITHFCRYATGTSSPREVPLKTDERIAVALERIAAVLEQQQNTLL